MGWCIVWDECITVGYFDLKRICYYYGLWNFCDVESLAVMMLAGFTALELLASRLVDGALLINRVIVIGCTNPHLHHVLLHHHHQSSRNTKYEPAMQRIAVITWLL